MSPLQELASGLWRFTVTRNGLPPTMTAYALRKRDTILVDPLVAGETEPLLAALDEIARRRVRILVTTPSTCAAPSFCGGAGATRTRSRSSGTSTAPRGSRTAPPSGPCAAARRSTVACARTRALTGLDVERVLVTHGEPVLRDGARALAASPARPPWSTSSLY